ncbi:MAG: small subunit ribosomal protein [Pyrinomonadaceae bacterium]|nr:small subunit ribosomal protein [Pyrinomonadaceae bacterium]
MGAVESRVRESRVFDWEARKFCNAPRIRARSPRARMSTEDNKLSASEATNENSQTGTGDATTAATATTPDASVEQQPQQQQSHASSSTAATAATTAAASPSPSASTAATGSSSNDDDDDDDEQRSGGDFDFGAMLDQYEQEQAAFQEGSVVRGTVVGINDRGVLIDFGFKSEGLVDQQEFTENGELTVKRGDEVEVLIKSMESQEGQPILSRADAVRMRAWDELEKAHRDGTPIKGRIIERVKGGLRVDVDGVDAFLPGSQVDSRPVRNLESFRGQEIEAKVIKLNRKRSNVVLSRKAILDEQNEGRKGETLDNLEESIIVDGQIKNLTDYGAFVDLGGIDGLLHVTDMSWGRLQNPAELFKVGETVQVKVLKFDRERERVSLGYKQLQPDPWESVEERFIIGSKVQGSVASVTDYGAFIELEPGVEGLVHVSEMSWSKRMKHPSKLVNVGDSVEAEVLGVDPKARRISLGMKQMQANPWQTLRERYQIGARVSGRVRNLTDFGAFIEVEDGVDGLVHVSDISWNKRIKHPGEVLKKGQEIEAVITNIDTENRRLSLSIKDTEPSSWDRFVNEHKPGDIVRGRITRFANFGAFVELDEGLEGLCHISELSDERVDKPEDVAQIGQEMEFRVLRIENDNKKIGLSARAASSDEPIVDTKSYSTEAKGGMASLAELGNFFAASTSSTASGRDTSSTSATGDEGSETATDAAPDATGGESAPEVATAGESNTEAATAGESSGDATGEASGAPVASAADAGNDSITDAPAAETGDVAPLAGGDADASTGDGSDASGTDGENRS